MALRSLLTSGLERTMTQLIDAAPSEIPVVQGEARAYRKLLKYLTDVPPQFDNAVD
jgi:hypothetical protein